MSAARPGSALRPHVKAFKTTALAARLVAAGHTGFCCATIREVEGMARDFLKEYYQVNVGSLELAANKAIRQTVVVCEDMDKCVA